MEFLINLPNGGLHYDFFSGFTCFACLFTFLIIGYRRNYPIVTLLLISGIVSFLAILGSQLITFTAEDWGYLFEHKVPPYKSARSALGAIILGGFGILLAQRSLNFKNSILDLYAIAFPVALIFQRIGCFLVGCCFGHHTHMPWGVKYGVFHQAWGYHYRKELIHWTSDYALPIHPVPIYFIIGYILTIFLLTKYKDRLKTPGNLALLGLVLLFGFRFFIEFARVPATNHTLGATFWGLKMIQWVCLIIVLVLPLIIKAREAIPQKSHPAYQVSNQLSAHLVLMVVLSLFILLSHQWLLKPVEVIFLLLHIAGASVLLVPKLLKQAYYPQKWSLGIAIVVALSCMGQTMKDQPLEEFTPRWIHALKAGAITGDVDFRYRICAENAGCGDDCDFYDVGPRFSSFGFAYEAIKHEAPGKYTGIGIGGHYTNYEVRVNEGESNQEWAAAGFLYSRWIYKETDIKAGFQYGRFRTVLGGRARRRVQPLFSMETGNLDQLFFIVSYGYDEPYGLLHNYGRLGLGFSLPYFGINVPAKLRLGWTNIGDSFGVFFEPEIFINRLILRPTIRVSIEDDLINQNLLNFGLSTEYRFGK